MWVEGLAGKGKEAVHVLPGFTFIEQLTGFAAANYPGILNTPLMEIYITWLL